MKPILRLYDGLLSGLAIIAGVLLVWLMVSILISVTMRNLAMQPFPWLFLSGEYGLFYLTMLGAPWLVRKRGHVHVELVTAMLPERAQAVLSRLVALGCVVVCLVLAYAGHELVSRDIARSNFDVRAYFTPKWLLTIAFPVSFGLMAVEFARFVFGRERMHTGEAGIHE